MPQFNYRGRDRTGRLHEGHRFAQSLDNLNTELAKEGIFPISISVENEKRSYFSDMGGWLQGRTAQLQELATFARQMQLLHQATVPMITSLKQLADQTRSIRLKKALNGIVDHLNQGETLAKGMSYYPETFSTLMVSMVEIGESTGHLSETFSHLHNYLQFEANSIKQIKASFRYPIFVVISTLLSIVSLNLFVVPTFAKFYESMTTGLPWETSLLIGSSNLMVHYGIYMLILGGLGLGYFFYYIRTETGRYRWHRFELSIPLLGKLLRRVIIIRLCQSLAVMLNSGLSVTQSLSLVKNVISNAYINKEVDTARDDIARGVPFTQAFTNIDLFTPLEVQILNIGEKNGEISSSLNYISSFHSSEIEYDLKRMNEWIGPLMIGITSGLILIISLGVYLPIWNMINLVHSQ